MKIEPDIKLDFDNVLIRPKRSILTSRNDVSLERSFTFPYSSYVWHGIPILASNMDTTGTFEVYDVLTPHKMITTFHKFYSLDDYKREFEKRNNTVDPDYYMVSTGIHDRDFERLVDIVEFTKCKWICIDIANGYLRSIVDFSRKVRERWPDKILVAGNVVTREMVEELILNGKVDVVKCGIGSGSACLTRIKTGVGMPQLSTVIECADAAHGVNGFIISDGGITNPGDMAKAFCAGADFVMCGGVFSGHDENEGEIIEEDGKKYKMFYGMSSKHAMERHYGKMENYRASEGRYIRVPYKGSLQDTLQDYMGGLRSCCTYINANTIKQMPKCATFVRVHQILNTSLVK